MNKLKKLFRNKWLYFFIVLFSTFGAIGIYYNNHLPEEVSYVSFSPSTQEDSLSKNIETRLKGINSAKKVEDSYYLFVPMINTVSTLPDYMKNIYLIDKSVNFVPMDEVTYSFVSFQPILLKDKVFDFLSQDLNYDVAFDSYEHNKLINPYVIKTTFKNSTGVDSVVTEKDFKYKNFTSSDFVHVVSLAPYSNPTSKLEVYRNAFKTAYISGIKKFAMAEYEADLMAKDYTVISQNKDFAYYIPNGLIEKYNNVLNGKSVKGDFSFPCYIYFKKEACMVKSDFTSVDFSILNSDREIVTSYNDKGEKFVTSRRIKGEFKFLKEYLDYNFSQNLSEDGE